MEKPGSHTENRYTFHQSVTLLPAITQQWVFYIKYITTNRGVAVVSWTIHCLCMTFVGGKHSVRDGMLGLKSVSARDSFLCPCAGYDTSPLPQLMHRAVSCRQVLGQYVLRHYIIKHSTVEQEFHLEGENISQYACAHRARTNSAQMLQWENTAALLQLLTIHTSQSSQDYPSSL